MAAIVYRRSAGLLRSLEAKPFSSERKFEDFILDNAGILGGDIWLLNRQILSGDRRDIPDLLGVDKEGRICLLELKNVEANTSVITQIMRYLVWARRNPDSIRSLWHESENRPQDVRIDWNNLKLRPILVAPAFEQGVIELAGLQMTPTIDVFRVQRYGDAKEEVVLVDKLSAAPPVRATTAHQNWTWEYYAGSHGDEAAERFKQAVDNLSSLASQHGWDLIFRLNKNYTGFMSGNSVVFRLRWASKTGWELRLKLPATADLARTGPHWRFLKYDTRNHEVVLAPVDPASPTVDEIAPLIEDSYQNVLNKRH